MFMGGCNFEHGLPDLPAKFSSGVQNPLYHARKRLLEVHGNEGIS